MGNNIMLKYLLRTVILSALSSSIVLGLIQGYLNDLRGMAFWTNMLTIGLLGGIIGGIIGRINYIKFIAPIEKIVKHIHVVSQGDFSGQIQLDEVGELKPIASSINLMMEKVRDLLMRVSKTVGQVMESTTLLSQNALETSAAMQQISATIENSTQVQTASLEDSSRIVQGIFLTTEKITDNARFVSTSSDMTIQVAFDGNQEIRNAIKQMNDLKLTINELATAIKVLGERSNEIGQIVEVITGISAQTNLLALNAAIEAARAGEHGKGFSVVANEVKKLAEQAENSAMQIGQLINCIKDETGQAVHAMDSYTKEVAYIIEAVNGLGSSFDRIISSVEEVSKQIEAVSACTDEMSTGTNQLEKSFKVITDAGVINQSISLVTAEQTQAVEDISKLINSLVETADELQGLMNQFRTT